MRKLFFIAVLAVLATTAQSQTNNIFSAGLCHSNGTPNFNPGARGCRVALDTTTQTLYLWKVGTTWVEVGDGIDHVLGGVAPLYTPMKWQSIYAVNDSSELYHYTNSAWGCLNCVTGATYTAGTGIAISGGNVISSTITQYTDEAAQDAVGAMIDGTLVYVDATPLLTRAALTGDVTASQGSNATTIATGVVGPTQLASTAVTPGSYTNANLTVDADGRVTAAANGSGGASDALGTGFTSGGGSGTVPSGTIVTTTDLGGTTSTLTFGSSSTVVTSSDGANSGALSIAPGNIDFNISNISGQNCMFSGSTDDFQFRSMDAGGDYVALAMNQASNLFSIEGTSTGFAGAQYLGDYSATIAANDRSIPDVGTIKGNFNGMYSGSGEIPSGTIATSNYLSYPVTLGGASSVIDAIDGFPFFGLNADNGTVQQQIGFFDEDGTPSLRMAGRSGSNYSSLSAYPTQVKMYASSPTSSTIIQSAYDQLLLYCDGVGAHMDVGDFTVSPKGLQYLGDYSATFGDESLVSKRYVDARVTSGSFSGTGTATTAFTVTIGATQPNNTYRVNITPTSALGAALFYISAKTTTTFTVNYLAGLTGTLTFDWALFK